MQIMMPSVQLSCDLGGWENYIFQCMIEYNVRNETKVILVYKKRLATSTLLWFSRIIIINSTFVFIIVVAMWLL